ncbi:hypothetical protein [Streptomyces californicus]|uniref:hypothetical protein n=1 Tax=Streptomyces californicus TaxID=67351 RepID=UPI00378B4D37
MQYVELHGTATKAGDPVKAAALGAALGNRRTSPLPVRSVKTNLGHTEGRRASPASSRPSSRSTTGR